MLGFCPICEKETKIEEILVKEDITIRGEVIPVETMALKCTGAGHIFDLPSSKDDYLERAYREYRTRKGMLQPEQIREIRTSHGLSQRELNNLLGWGGATLSRYENGALQSEAHDKLLQLIMDPKVLMTLIEAAPDAIDAKKKTTLISRLRLAAEFDCMSVLSHYESIYAAKKADEYSGFINFNAQKVRNVLIFLCQAPGTVKTKLNKLMFYADFLHCKSFNTGITGLKYAHLPYGPAPDQYTILLSAFSEKDPVISIQEEVFGDHVGEICRAVENPDISVFSQSEIKILAFVSHHFQNDSASSISTKSHDEDAYKNTRNGQLISYESSNSLSISAD